MSEVVGMWVGSEWISKCHCERLCGVVNACEWVTKWDPEWGSEWGNKWSIECRSVCRRVHVIRRCVEEQERQRYAVNSSM